MPPEFSPAPDAYTGLCAWLQANAPDVAFRVENDPINPPQNGPWVYVEMETHSVLQASRGSGDRTRELWREDGALILHVHVPLNTGSGIARKLAKRLGRLLRGREIDGCKFGGPAVNGGGASDRRSGFWVLPVVIPFEADD
jgi:hypothetical protein